MNVRKFLLSQRNNKHSRKRANGVRFWGYPERRAPITVIVVHTTESALGWGAMGTANWQAYTAPTPSSYHKLVDHNEIVVTTLDEHTAFHVVGLNSRALGVSFAYKAHLWGENPIREAAMLRNAAEAVKPWVKEYNIPVRWITLAQAKRGVKGFITHADADPSRRSDPGKNFPAKTFFALVEGKSTKLPNPTQEDDVEDYIKAVQESLNKAGYNSGPVDGLLGPKTKGAMQDRDRDAAKGIQPGHTVKL